MKTFWEIREELLEANDGRGAEKKGITRKVAKSYGDHGGPGGSDPIHVASHGDHHAYGVETDDDGTPGYAIHNVKTGKTSTVNLPSKKLSASQVHSHIKKHADSSTIAKHIANDHNDMH